MDIALIPEIIRRDTLPVPDHPGHHPQDLRIGDVTFKEGVVVPGDDIAIWKDAKNAVEDVLVPAPVKDNIILFTAAIRLWADLGDIPALTEQGKHAVSYVGVYDIAIGIKHILKGHSTTYSFFRYE